MCIRDRLGANHVQRYLRSAGFEELHFLRRYCAKLIYEIELYGGAMSWDSLPDLYVEQLTSATTFRYDRADAFIDVDPRYYAARYLRAWQLQALIRETLVERYDDCLLYTSDAADERSSVDLGGRRII